ncbi:MAG: hypothetical protein QOI64_2547 [Solirubrobacteraceae bacterium]|nr:hypothetical protein [Solirubrobacteraceae bacterium]
MTSLTPPRVLRAVAVSACLAIGGLAGASSPASAASTKTCKASSTKYPNANPGGYFTSLKVTGVSCSSGAKLMLAYYKCRRKNGQGVEGKCKASKVNGMTCTEKRPASGNNGSEFNATVTCKSGSKKIVHTYQQNLG